ncbi:hypothetical protein OIDMADRAFT_19740 [Oidiodendron maius Zn]|uniref:Uncharacterized protein n=1 Tax=Oidiodendron maius (strain Zn) TaxID=913774 RepID=A0A0C3HBG3_OIDMZ|nr:hypothetical protein OIDMADRAFT_19740 [Oidiodendron maius Zn]
MSHTQHFTAYDNRVPESLAQRRLDNGPDGKMEAHTTIKATATRLLGAILCSTDCSSSWSSSFLHIYVEVAGSIHIFCCTYSFDLALRQYIIAQ